MSYILDALRRADAERDRGAVPNLHSQQFGALPGDDEAPARPRLLIGIIAVLAVALVAVLGWNLLSRADAPKVVAQAPTPVTIAPPVAPPTPAASSAAVPVPVPVPVPPPTASAPAPAAVPPMARRPPRQAVPRDAPAAEVAPTPAAGASTAASERVYAQSELPEAIRRELPKLAFGGASYSSDKASRLVFLNGQVFHEGDTVVPGVVVRQIRQKGAVLAFKGYRYEVGF
jgi:general secretion pathway protein B